MSHGYYCLCEGDDLNMQTTYSSAFSWKKIYEFQLNFHWSLFLSSIGSDNGLAPARWQAIIWTNDGQFTDAYMHHSASMS